MPAKTPKILTPLYDRMRQDIILGGLASRTIDSYLRHVRKFEEFLLKSPDIASEDDLRRYLLYIKNDCDWEANSLSVAYSALKFFYRKTCPSDWPVLKNLRVQRQLKLPAILDRADVDMFLNAIHKPSMFAFFCTVYALGLRLQEALNLQVTDIDSKRMLVHIHRGKGAKDRLIPLPVTLLNVLRKYWASHRNSKWIFPSEGKNHSSASTTDEPMSQSGVQGCITKVVKDLGWQNRGISTHTLRHCYATHLLEDGVNLRQIQKYMGHACLQTTTVYLHLTTYGEEAAVAKINQLMADRIGRYVR